MNLNWYANVGDDVTPNWIELIDDMMLHFTGAGSTASNATPIVRPDAGYVWNEEIWLGLPVMVGGQKLSGWVKPSAAVQSGKIIKVVFSEKPNAAPVISAYDNTDYDSWDKEILAGTEQTLWKGLIKLFCTGSESSNTPPAQNWAYQETGIIGNANPNCLSGNESFVTVPFIPDAAGDVTFVPALAIPADVGYGKDGRFDPILSITFVHV